MRSFSMNCFAGGLGRKPQKEPATGSSKAGLSSINSAAVSGSSGAGETSKQLRRLLVLVTDRGEPLPAAGTAGVTRGQAHLAGGRGAAHQSR